MVVRLTGVIQTSGNRKVIATTNEYDECDRSTTVERIPRLVGFGRGT